MTLSQFKKDLHLGLKFRVKEHGIRKERENLTCYVSKIQTNGFYNVYDNDIDKKNVWLDFPKANAFDYNGKVASFYFPIEKNNNEKVLLVSFEKI